MLPRLCLHHTTYLLSFVQSLLSRYESLLSSSARHDELVAGHPQSPRMSTRLKVGHEKCHGSPERMNIMHLPVAGT